MIYAEVPHVRRRQLLGDATLVLWIVVWVRAGAWVHDQVERLAAPPEALASAGRQIASAGREGGDAVGGLPGVGDGLESLFGRLQSGGDALVDAGRTGSTTAGRLALLLGLFVAAVPIVWLVGRMVPGRVRWSREATAAQRLREAPGAEELFALRALAGRSLADLVAAEADPMLAYREGRTDRLAAVELRHLGLEGAPGRPHPSG